MVLPIGDINPVSRRTFVVWTILAINVGVFAYQSGVLAGCGRPAFVYQWATVPQEVLEGNRLSGTDLDGLLGPCATDVADKNVWLSVLTSMFLHGGLAHLAGNMVFLAVFGDNVEARLGHVRFLLFYLVGGVVATAAFVALDPGSTVPLIGASGAIAAVLGAYLVCFPRARVLTIVPFPLYLIAVLLPGVRIRRWLIIAAIVALPAWLLLSGWFVMQAVAVDDPLAGTVAYEAHVAGFISGIVLLLALDRRRSRHGQQPFHPGGRP